MTLKSKLLSLTAFAVLASAGAASADDEVDPFSICDIDPANYVAEISEGLVGNWSAQNPEGVAVMAGGGMIMPIPMPAEAPSSVDFVLQGDQLYATSWMDAEAPMLPIGVAPSSPVIDQVAEALDSALSEAETSVVIGCDITAYPILRTEFSLSEDGVTLSYVAVFRVLSESLIQGAVYGSVVGEEGSINAYRPVVMSR